MPTKEAKTPKAPPRWWLAHSGDMHYISTKTGAYRTAHSREILDDLPAQSVIDGKSGPNWVITEGIVQPYTGERETGQLLPLAEVPPVLLAQVQPALTMTEVRPGVFVVTDATTPPPAPAPTEETP